MGIKGDFGKFVGLEAALTKLASVPSRAASQIAENLNNELEQEFDQGRDPYGKTWAPLKPATLKTGRTPPPLTATGQLRAGTKATAMRGSGVQLVAGAGYGAFHQTGTKNMARRAIFPYGAIPARWTQIIKSSIQRAYNK